LHVAIVGPMSVSKIARELLLEEKGGNTPPPEPSGAHSVTDLVLGLYSKVNRLDLITLDPNIRTPYEYRGDRVRLAAGPYRPRVRTMSKDLFRDERSFVARRLRAWKPEVAGAHWTYEFALGLLDSGVPHLITVRDWAPTILWSMRDPYRTVRLYMQLLTFARGRNFAAVSPYMARRVERVIRRPVAVVPNGIGSTWLAAAHADPTGFDVLAVNHGFDRRKNVRRLLSDWPQVVARVPGALLHLVGHGFQEGGPAHHWSAARQIDQNVVFHGPVPRTELPEMLKKAKVFVHPSLEESFGMTVLEAMASGVPVVGGAKSGAIPWLLSGGAGLLVDVKTDGAIADGIIRILVDSESGQMIGELGRARATEFGLERVVRCYIESLSAVTTGANGSAP